MKINKKFALLLLSTIIIAFIMMFYFNVNFKNTDIHIAALLPFDGQVSNFGEMMRNGHIMAEEEINAKLIHGEPRIKIDFYNTSHKKDLALNRMEEASRNGIKFFVEIFGSDQAAHCFDFANQNQIFILSGVDTKPDLIEKGRGCFYRIMPNDAEASNAILQWAKEKELKNLAILYANDDWGLGLKQATIRNSSDLNINILDKIEVLRNQLNFSSIVTKLKTYKLDAILLFIYPDDGGRFLKEATRQDLKTSFFATENFWGNKMTETAKNSANDVMIVVPKTYENENLQKFKNNYKAKFGEEPTIFAIKAYDAVKFIYQIVLSSGNNTNKAKEITKKLTYSGISGKISFDKFGEYIPLGYDRLIFKKIYGNYQPIKVIH
ncbi:MAG: amino acid ABC transporter substrate-binding protein [Bacteroidetes bacterium]|nr:MAG: amino acid ABC transporter substrate-binding protein [Bacteroidota bacterium]